MSEAFVAACEAANPRSGAAERSGTSVERRTGFCRIYPHLGSSQKLETPLQTDRISNSDYRKLSLVSQSLSGCVAILSVIPSTSMAVASAASTTVVRAPPALAPLFCCGVHDCGWDDFDAMVP